MPREVFVRGDNTHTPTTPTRRARPERRRHCVGLMPMGLATTALLDAAIIALCNHLVTLEGEAVALCAQRLTIADEHRTEPELIAIEARRDAAVAELEHLGPPMAGIQAVARASLVTLQP
jgi:hypothetical protein